MSCLVIAEVGGVYPVGPDRPRPMQPEILHVNPIIKQQIFMLKNLSF